MTAQVPSPPSGVQATGFDSHIEVRWQTNQEPGITAYQVYRSTDDGANYSLLKTVPGSQNNALDWTGDEGQTLTRYYRIKAVKNVSLTSDFSDPVSAQTRPFSDEELLEMVQQYTFRYFWDYGHPVSGLARERSNGSPDIVTTGGSGFGIMALVVGVERGWITRTEAVNRMVQIISFLQGADRYHGVFPHWMNGNTGAVFPFSQYDNGADLVETAFLIQGMLAARQYFDQDTPLEKSIRNAITGLWEDVEWDWFRKNGSPVLYWHWSPNYGWQINFALRGFFEAQIVYILAAASPTHPVPGSLYQSGWTASPNYCSSSSFFGYKPYCGNYAGGPMFFAHYSYLGFDPRGWKDACCNYFVRNRNHALIQWEYSKANPENHKGYSANCWGLTACDGPNGYSAHDIYPSNDDGTIAPTAALASMPYAPAQSIAALKYFYRTLGENLWGPYGFYDSFNEDLNWFAPSFLAIDQGPIVGMIENHRTGLLWNLFMKNPEIEPALLACGFMPDSTVATRPEPIPGLYLDVYPNPAAASGGLSVDLQVDRERTLTVDMLNIIGTPVRRLLNSQTVPGGLWQQQIDTCDLPKGVYFIRIKTDENQSLIRKILISG